MRTKTLICAGIASAGLMGCTTMSITKDALTSTSCDGRKVCVIPVTVVNCVVSIPPDKANVYINNNNVAILWHLTPASVAQKYAFDANKGVVLKDMDMYFQFTAQGPVFNDWAFFWLDRNTNNKDYDYTINIVDVGHGGAACRELDPKIINQ